MNTIASAINDDLQETGFMFLPSLAERYALPFEFIKNAVKERIGSVIQGTLVEDELFTEAFERAHYARMRGAMRALSKPTTLPQLMKLHAGLNLKLATEHARQIVEAKEAPVEVRGSSVSMVITPFIFARLQERQVRSFFAQNGYIEYSMLQGLGIVGPQKYLADKFPGGMALATSYVDPSVVQRGVDAAEAAVAESTYLNVANELVRSSNIMMGMTL